MVLMKTDAPDVPPVSTFFRENAVMAGDDAMSKVTLARPAAGETAHIAMQRGHVYLLEFDLGETTVADNGKDVLLTFDDGSGMVLQNFFSAAKAGDFYLTLPDGAMLSGQAVVESLALSLENFHPSGDCAFAGDVHDGLFSPLSSVEDDSSSGRPHGFHCEVSAGHVGYEQPFSPASLDEADFFTSGRGSIASSSPFAHGPASMSDGLSSSFSSFSLHDGGRAPHLGDLLDMSVPPTRSAAPVDLDSLLPPAVPSGPASSSDAHHGAESGQVPADNTAVHPLAAVVSSADSGDESQDQHLLAQLFLLSL